MADSSSQRSTVTAESRNKLFLQARVPEYLEITYLGFTACGRAVPPHTMCAHTTPMRGAKLLVEFTEDNIK